MLKQDSNRMDRISRIKAEVILFLFILTISVHPC